MAPTSHALVNLSDGATTVTATARDASYYSYVDANRNPVPAVHVSAPQTTVVKLDREAPEIAASGTLNDSRNAFVSPDYDYTLTVTATDGSLSSPAAQRSGATSLTATLDGQPMTDGSASNACTRPEGSCSLTINAALTAAQVEELDETVPHTIEIKATDALGHEEIDSFSIRVDAVAPDITLDGNLVDLEQRTLTESSYRLRAEARDNTPDTFEVGDDGKEYPDFNTTGAGLRDLVIRLDGQTVSSTTLPCFTDPACEDARAWDWDTTQAPNGEHLVEVTAADRAGNQETQTFTVDLQRAPDAPTETITTALRTIDGAALGDRAGASVASMGDVNGDQRTDYLVGAPGSSVSGRTSAGAVYVVFGSSDMASLNLASPGASARRIDGPSANAYCGTAIAPTGDVNADGHDDFLIGCPGRDSEIGSLTSTTGRAFVVFGSSDPRDLDLANLGSAGFAITGPIDPPSVGVPLLNARPAVFSERLGSVPSARGVLNTDVNGDSLADIVIGDSSTASAGLAGAGAAYVIFGKTDTTSVDVTALQTRGFVIGGSIANGLAGYSAVIGGDLDQDALADIVVGAPGATSADTGRAYVISGATGTTDIDLGLPSERVVTLTTSTANDRFGVNVTALGDTNLDTRDDLGIATRSGAYVIRKLPASGGQISADDGFRVTGPSNDPGLRTEVPGTAIGAAGDLDGDERADVIIGYPDAAGARAVTVFSPEASRTLNAEALPGQRGSVISIGTQQDRAGAAVAASPYQGQTPVTETGQALIGAPNAAPDVLRLNAGRVFLMAQRIPSGPGVEPEAEPSALGRATAIPGRYPISMAEATEWATLRSDYQQLVFGNLPNETLFTIKKLNKGKKPRSAFGYATANLSNRKRCGWVDLQSLNLEDGEPAASPRTCGYSVFRVNRFAALVNCDKCGDGSFVPFRSGTDAAAKPMPAQIPLYRNLTPFGPNERGRDREPTRTLDTTRPDPDNPSQTVPNEVRFRYITRSGRWLLIKNRAFGNNQWGFVESKFFPDRFGVKGLCGTTAPPRNPDRTNPRRTGWPKVCQTDQYRVEP